MLDLWVFTCLGQESNNDETNNLKENHNCRAYNIQLVPIAHTHSWFNIRTIFHTETEIVQNMGLL